ncbi:MULTISPECIES: TraB/GumN family protein [unclassified Pseudoalteromonas]|uniref:TraB/GumN family protein n=1 Tax=unclassified Pseudoalteromonas TaxID=194690 RepID=UPI000B732AAF|nr:MULTISPECIES: TraB/GumN family protein [unclassified Pseudoalteromonas]MAJ39103.1 TraB/GumN family protein [Pseudoalteromonadaceae bacterium]OUX91744.1 MAG: TraB/GumN family protein [Pseudoalteromonas sp. TMED43]MDC9563728.1 TraB/GumN family protein [Pseudoalteromonas sp. GAB2316C]MDC9570652.1 TraB/GumN family protein [Pseudoalteromonas sp. GABNB9D]MDC9572503.1 TraB/GumN family protein [Pseudoalteromonas sp. GABNS16A]|tara:strand:- start:715 stop:1593 length:879 start_codon:yes stop_codon:yes gene_type:complete
MQALTRISQLFTLALFIATSFNSVAAPALFKVEKNGTSSYLFGTVHVGDASMKGLPEKVTKAIDQSEQVVVEVDISKLTPLQMQQRSMPFMMLKDGKTLQTELSKQNYNKLKDYFAKKSIDIAMFNGLKPWAVMVTMMQIEFQNAGFSDQTGIDKQVLAYAKKQNITIGELETLEQQLQMFDGMALLSNEMIEETFEQLADINTYFIKLVNAWKNGDMDTLTEYYNMSFDESNYGEISEQVMLVNRNNKWVEQLVPRLTNEKLFIAVGALHLPEQHGLIKQLTDAGFTITRL